MEKKSKLSPNEAPDQASVSGQQNSPNINSHQERAKDAAGARGSNHVGQGSAGDSTHRSPVSGSASADSPNPPSRKGNSAPTNLDAKANEDVDTELRGRGAATARDPSYDSREPVAQDSKKRPIPNTATSPDSHKHS